MPDIDTLIQYASSLTTLSQHGNRYYGICPIPAHQEKTGSFIIDTKSGRWKCFGCGAGGSNAIYLYMEIHGCEWRDAKKALGLWDNKLPQPRARPPTPPRHFASDDKRECYRVARETLVQMWDCEIEHDECKQSNHDFILGALSNHQDRDQYIEKILIDIGLKNMETRTKGDIDLFLILFVNECYLEV